jgi:hypothetical protein
LRELPPLDETRLWKVQEFDAHEGPLGAVGGCARATHVGGGQAPLASLRWAMPAAGAPGILRGAKPEDLPVEQAAKFDLAGEKNTLNPLGSLVFHPPLGESVERRNEGAAVLGEAVLGRENRPLVKFAPRNNAVGLEIAQVL